MKAYAQLAAQTAERVVILSPREKKLLRRLAQGKSDKHISVEIGGRADQLSVQRKRLVEKLKIRSHDQLVTLAQTLAAWPEKPQPDS
jgi:DNA-binding CsgD family transcriptional regulator